MQLNKYGQWWVSIHLKELTYLVLAFHPLRWRVLWRLKLPQKTGTERTWIGPLEIELSDFAAKEIQK